MQADEYATMFRVEETHWWYRALHRLIFENLEREVPDWRQKAILDAGCGTGAILKQLGNPEKNKGVDLAGGGFGSHLELVENGPGCFRCRNVI